jgi:hypothetical protein
MRIARRGHALIVGKATKYPLSFIDHFKDQTFTHYILCLDILKSCFSFYTLFLSPYDHDRVIVSLQLFFGLYEVPINFCMHLVVTTESKIRTHKRWNVPQLIFSEILAVLR